MSANGAAGAAGSMGTLAAWTALRRQFGTPVALLYVVHRLLERSSGGRARIVPYAFYAQPMGSPRLTQVRDDAQTQVLVLAPGSAFEAAFPRPPAIIAARFASGAQCWVASHKGGFGGYIWLARQRYLEDEVRCEYRLAEPEHAVWDFDVFVEPRLRLGRTLARLWKAVDQALQAEGVAWSFSRISLFNPGSSAAHARLGARRVGTAVFVVLGPIELMLSSQSPWLWLSFGPRAVPVLRFVPPAVNCDGAATR